MGEWLSFGVSDETIPIHLGTVSSTQSDLQARVLALEASLLNANAQIKVAQAAAGAPLGAAKRPPLVLIDLGPCQSPTYFETIKAPKGVRKRNLCKSCYETFIKTTDRSLSFRDGRTVS